MRAYIEEAKTRHKNWIFGVIYGIRLMKCCDFEKFEEFRQVIAYQEYAYSFYGSGYDLRHIKKEK